MKNLVSFLVYNNTIDTFEFLSPKRGIDFEDRFLPVHQQVPKRLYDEIDLIKKQKIRRLPHSFKDNAQRIC